MLSDHNTKLVKPPKDPNHNEQTAVISRPDKLAHKLLPRKFTIKDVSKGSSALHKLELRNITQLSLVINMLKLSSHDLRNLITAVSGLKLLTAITLNLSNNGYIEQLQILSNAFRFLNNLNSVTLFVHDGIHLTNSGICSLLSALRTHSTVSTLTMSFSGTYNAKSYVTRDVIEGIAANMKYFLSLKTFTIRLQSTLKVDLDWMKSFSHGLKSLQQLRNFTLTLKYSQSLSNSALECLSKGLEKLKFLSSVNINFNICPLVGEVGVGHLMKSLKLLSNLNLEFIECPLIQDHTLKEIGHGLRGLPALSVLKLSFHKCCGITDSGFNNLVKGLNHLLLLKSLCLRLNNPYGISNKAIEKLCSTLKGLKKLVKLQLDFSGCSEISIHCLRHIKKYIQAPEALSEINLEFMACKEITGECITEFCSEVLSQSPAIKLTFNRKIYS